MFKIPHPTTVIPFCNECNATWCHNQVRTARTISWFSAGSTYLEPLMYFFSLFSSMHLSKETNIHGNPVKQWDDSNFQYCSDTYDIEIFFFYRCILILHENKCYFVNLRNMFSPLLLFRVVLCSVNQVKGFWKGGGCNNRRRWYPYQCDIRSINYKSN